MINLEDIKIFLVGGSGFTLTYIPIAEIDLIAGMISKVVIVVATLYTLYINHKKKK